MTPSLSVEDRGAQIQNIESFPNVNILALTNLFENTFLQNDLFLNKQLKQGWGVVVKEWIEQTG